MKAVMQAIWLMVVAFGNLIDIIVISAQSEDPNAGLSQAQEFFMFAGNSSRTFHFDVVELQVRRRRKESRRRKKTPFHSIKSSK
jgi:dipeptide/tripeptide permease